MPVVEPVTTWAHQMKSDGVMIPSTRPWTWSSPSTMSMTSSTILCHRSVTCWTEYASSCSQSFKCIRDLTVVQLCPLSFNHFEGIYLLQKYAQWSMLQGDSQFGVVERPQCFNTMKTLPVSTYLISKWVFNVPRAIHICMQNEILLSPRKINLLSCHKHSMPILLRRDIKSMSRCNQFWTVLEGLSLNNTFQL